MEVPVKKIFKPNEEMTEKTRDVSIEMLAKPPQEPGFLNNLWLHFTSFFPMMLAIFMLASSTSLFSMRRGDHALELPTEFGQWILFYSLTLAAPVTAYLGQVVPTGWMLLAGALVSMAGHASLFLSTPTSQILLLAITTGFGTSIIFQAAYVSLSERFCRLSVPVCLMVLLILAGIMVSAHPLTTLTDPVYPGIAVIVVVVVVACISLAGILIKGYHAARTNTSALYAVDPASIDDEQNLSGIRQKMMSDAGDGSESNNAPFLTSLILLFILWEPGVDLTWLSYHHPEVSLRVASLQCVCSLICLGVSFMTHTQMKHTENADGSFLALGLIGTAGIDVIIFPNLVNIFHVMFSVAYIAQIMDFVAALGPSFSLARPLASSADSMQISQSVWLSEQAVHPSWKRVTLLLLAAVVLMFFNPLTYILCWFLMSVQTETQYDEIMMGVLSCMAVGLSCVQPRGRTKPGSSMAV